MIAEPSRPSPADALLGGTEPWRGRLWRRWVAANAVGEALGLGLAGATGAGLLVGGALAPWPTAAAMVAAGCAEGAIVGAAQWLALRPFLPGLGARAWVGASAAGAGVAWALGMLPSTLLAGAEGADGGLAGLAETSDATMYAMAASMGLVLGPLLGWVQWLVLRRHARAAGRWIWANAAAWAAGMPLVFAGAGGAPTGGPAVAAYVLALLAVAGAAVGAVHGSVLVRMVADTRR